MRYLLLLLVMAAPLSALQAMDYFVRLPAKSFEAPPDQMLAFLKQPKCGVVDVANGYISCIGDGAQPGFEVALFRYRNGRPLLAVCSNELEGLASVYLEFFEIGSDVKMHKVKRSLFPVGDAGNGKGNWRFELPREGKTILVRDQGSKNIISRFRWNGESFQEAK